MSILKSTRLSISFKTLGGFHFKVPNLIIVSNKVTTNQPLTADQEEAQDILNLFRQKYE